MDSQHTDRLRELFGGTPDSAQSEDKTPKSWTPPAGYVPLLTVDPRPEPVYLYKLALVPTHPTEIELYLSASEAADPTAAIAANSEDVAQSIVDAIEPTQFAVASIEIVAGEQEPENLHELDEWDEQFGERYSQNGMLLPDTIPLFKDKHGTVYEYGEICGDDDDDDSYDDDDDDDVIDDDDDDELDSDDLWSTNDFDDDNYNDEGI